MAVGTAVGGTDAAAAVGATTAAAVGATDAAVGAIAAVGTTDAAVGVASSSEPQAIAATSAIDTNITSNSLNFIDSPISLYP